MEVWNLFALPNHTQYGSKPSTVRTYAVPQAELDGLSVEHHTPQVGRMSLPIDPEPISDFPTAESILEMCDDLLAGVPDSQTRHVKAWSRKLKAVKAYIAQQEDTIKANELVLRQTRAHVVQLGTMTTHLQTSRDEYRERVRRFEDGWETCIKTMSDIDIPSPSVAGNRPSTVYSDEDEE